jgi:hypothetical protein
MTVLYHIAPLNESHVFLKSEASGSPLSSSSARVVDFSVVRHEQLAAL